MAKLEGPKSLSEEARPCPMPRPSQILTAAGRTVECGVEATVITAVPMKHPKTGETGIMLQYLCLHHAVSIATWKLIERIREADRARRIVLP